MSGAATPRLVADSACICGEGLLWDPATARVWWVDMVPPLLFALEPESGTLRRWEITGERIAAAVLRGPSGLLLAGASGIGRIEPLDGAAAVAVLPRLPLPLLGGPSATFNDAKVHPSGAVVLASADTEERAALGLLERVDGGGGRETLGGPFVIGNGPAFSPDGRTMYASDTVGRRVLAYPLDGEGRAAGPARVFATIEVGEGMPDGMTTDHEGALWVAFWDGGQVLGYDPDGRVMARVPMLVRNVTNVAFGGAEFATLWITTARADLAGDALRAQPGAGGLFAVETQARGRAEPVAAL